MPYFNEKVTQCFINLCDTLFDHFIFIFNSTVINCKTELLFLLKYLSHYYIRTRKQITYKVSSIITISVPKSSTLSEYMYSLVSNTYNFFIIYTLKYTILKFECNESYISTVNKIYIVPSVYFTGLSSRKQ